MSNTKKHNLRELAEAFDRHVRKHHGWRATVTVLAAIVVFVTAYLLVLPAVTLESNVDVPGMVDQLSEDVETAGESDSQSSPDSSEMPADGAEKDEGQISDLEVEGVDSADEADSDDTVASENAASGDTATEQPSGYNDGETQGNNDEPQTDTVESEPTNTQVNVTESTTQPPVAAPQAVTSTNAETSSQADPEPSDVPDASVESTAQDATGAGESVTLSDALDEVLGEGTAANAEGKADAISWRVVRDTRGIVTLYVEGEGGIPDYGSYNNQPWRKVATSAALNNIMVGEGITRVGDRGFDTLRADGTLSLPSTLKSVGVYAFANNSFFGTVAIPDAVTAVGSYAFSNESNNNTIEKFVFGSGVKTIGTYALYGAIAPDGEVVLPSGLQSVDAFSFYNCAASSIVISGNTENSKFFVGEADGVLYRRNGGDPETWTVVKYPANRRATEYVMPDQVTAVDQQAFRYCKQLQKITIPDSVQVTIPEAAFSYSDFSEVSIGSGATISNMNSLFYECDMLRKVEISDDAACGTSFKAVYSGAHALEEATIPASITTIGSDAFQGCYALRRLEYDAANAESFPTTFASGKLSYELVIGDNVQNIAVGFEVIGRSASKVSFDANHTFTVEEGAFSSLPSPLSSVSGSVYVDASGLVYVCDEDGTASLVYCPPRLESATVPGAVEVNGRTFTVDTVRRDALKFADELEGIVFEAPDSIRLLETNALASCPTLSSVNGKTTVAEAKSTFSNNDVVIGYGVFNNTGLTDALNETDFGDNMTGSKELSIAGTGEYAELPRLSITVDEGPEWVSSEESQDNVGGYRLLTGNSLQATVKLEIGQETDAAYRVFVHFTDEDGTLADMFRPGSEIEYSGQKIQSYATSDPHTFVIEFIPAISGTIEFPVSMFYPSPSSAGGGVLIWGEVGDSLKDAGRIGEDGVVSVDESNRPSSDADMIFAQWTTEQTHWKVRKTANGIAGTQIIKGEGENEGKLAKELVWNISHSQVSGGNTEGSAGKDYVKYYELEDVLTMPAGMSLESDVVAAIKAGEVSVVTTNPSNQRWVVTMVVGDKRVVSVENTSSWDDTPKGVELGISDEGQLEFRFQFENSNGDTIGSSEMVFRGLAIRLYPDAVTVDLSKYNKDGDVNIVNKATSTLHYHYGKPYTSESEVKTALGNGAGSLTITQTSSLETDEVAYLGEDVTYTVSLSNPGAMEHTVGASGAAFQVTDTIGENAYIRPENMEKMLNGQDGEKLEIVITNATLLSNRPLPEVSHAFGEDPAYKTPANSDLSSSGGHKLSISKTDTGEYQLVVDGGEPITGSSVTELLRSVGYDVTPDSTYACTWTLAEANEDYKIAGSTTIDYEVLTTVKNTFQATDTTRETEIPEDSLTNVPNSVSVTRGQKAPGQLSHDFVREAVLGKSYQIYRDGEPTDVSLGGAKDKDVIDYSIDFSHYGNGVYESLPFIDRIAGNQRLLVPVRKNPGLEGKGLVTVTFGGSEYYVLTEGSYEDVLVGFGYGMDLEQYWTADSVSVSENNTEIVWYIGKSPAESYQLSLRYQTIVDLSESSGDFSLGNTVRANDATKGNLWTTVTGGGSMIAFEKNIVVSQDSQNPANDVLAADGYSAIRRGEPVTYRLRFTNNLTDEYKLSGTDVMDALPNTYGAFTWDDGHVKVSGTGSSEGVDFNGWDNQWSVQDEYKDHYKFNGPLDSEYQQYICWGPDASITIPRGESAYVYVTLSFPEGESWQLYCDAAEGKRLYNALWVYGYESMVSHELSEQGSVLLQKGVYGTYTGEELDGGRYYYSNADWESHGVIYYVALVNTGNKRLYINDIQDYLPRGFSYKNLIRDGNWVGANTSSITTYGGAEDGLDNPLVSFSGVGDITYKTATIDASASGRKLVFRVSQNGEGENSIGYDEELDKCYLEKNEALVFGYRTATDSAASTSDDSATNLVAMAYSDPSNSGVRSSLDDGVTISGYEGLASDGATDLGSPNDDPLPEIMTTEAFDPSAYGFADEEDNTSWLVSDVAVTRGGIVPGLVKTVESTADPRPGATTQSYTGSATPDAIITWNLRAYNTGNQTMNDYMISDELPAPYTFVGDVIHVGTFDENGNSVWITDQRPMVSIAAHSLGDKKVEVTWRDESDPDEIYADGRWYCLNSSLDKPNTGDGNFQMSLDSRGEREILRVRFVFHGRNIPANGGYSEIKVSSRNTTDTFNNAVYTNYAYLTPLTQDFTSVYQGAETTITSDILNGASRDWHSVMASTSVNVAGGSIAGIQKDVAENDEKGKTENTASSWSTNNAIRLEGEASEVIDGNLTYDFTITNGTGRTLSDMVMIDNLPRIGDVSAFDQTAPRNSEFSVQLANGDFTLVEVADSENGPVTIPLVQGTDYMVEYCTDVSPTFGDEDWSGAQSDRWSEMVSSFDGVTAFRITLDHAIKDGSKILVSFKAKTGQDASPDATAWNSFGYTCQRETSTAGITDTLQAMTASVGVRMQTVPELTKEVVNAQGGPNAVDGDHTFSYMVYEGDAVSYEDQADLESKLSAAGRSYKGFDVVVESGSSEAEKLLTLDGWTWKNGETYSITELPSMANGYSFQGIRGTNGNVSGTADPGLRTYTFTYQRDRNEEITCTNLYEEWSIELTKVNGDTNEPLEGAAFALYSRIQPDADPTVPSGLGDVAKTVEVGGTTYYLYSVVDLANSSTHAWKGLTAQNYYLMEVRTPEGYVEPTSGWLLYRSNANSETQALSYTVKNYMPYELPSTGGNGKTRLVAGGVAIMAASACAYALWHHLRRVMPLE